MKTFTEIIGQSKSGYSKDQIEQALEINNIRMHMSAAEVAKIAGMFEWDKIKKALEKKVSSRVISNIKKSLTALKHLKR